MCQSELTEFFAELTEFAAELSEFSPPKQHSRNSIPPVSYKLIREFSALSQSRVLGGDATKHFSVKTRGFSVKRGEAIQ